MYCYFLSPGSALKCWRCSSDEGVCDDPFNTNSLTVQQRQFRYVDCYLAQEPQQPYVSMKFRPVCKKTIQKGEENFFEKKNSKFWPINQLSRPLSQRQVHREPDVLLGGCYRKGRCLPGRTNVVHGQNQVLSDLFHRRMQWSCCTNHFRRVVLGRADANCEGLEFVLELNDKA